MSTKKEEYLKGALISQLDAFQQSPAHKNRMQQARDLMDAAERPIGQIIVSDEPIRATLIRALPALVAVAATAIIGMIERKNELE